MPPLARKHDGVASPRAVLLAPKHVDARALILAARAALDCPSLYALAKRLDMDPWCVQRWHKVNRLPSAAETCLRLVIAHYGTHGAIP